MGSTDQRGGSDCAAATCPFGKASHSAHSLDLNRHLRGFASVVGLHFALQGFRRGVSALAHASSFLYPPLLGHREGNIGLAPSGTAVLCFGFVALWVLVPPTAQV